MIRWPWVSRLAFDAVVDERDRLREKNDQLIEHITRIARTEHGLTEVPRPPRPSHEPMPDKVKAYIDQWEGDRFRQELSRSAYRMHIKEGRSWAEIEQQLREDTEGGEQEA